jgi:uncharacterized damage-inducible protein DinB
MKTGDMLLAEWERESSSTLKMLENVPEDMLSWKPHERSKSLGALAQHVAGMPQRFICIFDNDSFDPTLVRQPELKDKKDIIKLFEEGSVKLTDGFKKTKEDEYDKLFTFQPGGKVLFTMPKVMAFRILLFNHLIHHRAQLSVYLRLLNAPVPGMYGPSADDKPL